MLLRSAWVTIGDIAALSLIRLTMPRASAKASRGVSHPPVAVKAAPQAQHRQKRRLVSRTAFMGAGSLPRTLPMAGLRVRSRPHPQPV